MKKFLSWLLTVTMLLSLVVIPVAAEGMSVVELSTITFTDKKDGTITAGNEISELEPGDLVAVKATITNNTNAAFYVGAYALEITYDKNVFEPITLEYLDENEDPVQTKAVVYENAKLIGKYANAVGTTDSTVNWSGATTETYAKVANAGTLVMGYALFKVSEDAENGAYSFGFSNNADKNFFSVSASNSGQTNYLGEISFADTAVGFVVNGAAPTIGTVALDQASVTVKGGETAAQTVQATATSTSGKDITKQVKWTAEPAENSSGVTINETTGAITVANNAKGSYTIKAIGKEGSSLDNKEAVAFPTLTVIRNPSAPATITLSGGQAELLIPADGEEAATSAAFTAAVKDQYNETYAGGQSVTWTIKEGDVVVDGITIANGVVSVTNAVKEAIARDASKTMTVTASCGDATNFTTIVVKRAASVGTTVKLFDAEEAEAAPAYITIPVSGKPDAAVTYTAKLYDQYGAEMTGDFAWTVKDGATLPAGTTMANGTVTVAAGAEGTGTFTLVATDKTFSKSAEIAVTVNKLKVNWSGVTITTKDAPTYGDTNNAIIKAIEETTLQYNTDGSDTYNQTLTGTYSVVNPDTIQGAGEKTITIQFKANDDETNVDYKGLELTTTVPVTIAKKAVTVVSDITAADKTYDGTTAATVDASTAVFEGRVGEDTLTITGVTGTFDTKNVGTDKTVTLDYGEAILSDSTNYYLAETGNQVSATANITPADLTVDVNGVTVTKVYDGTNTATGAALTGDLTLTGVYEGDDVTLVVPNPLVGTFNSANVKDAKTFTITGLTLGGADKSNYILDADGAVDVAGVITQKEPEFGTDFEIDLPNNPTYDGTAKAVTVNKQNNAIGDITVKYNGSTTAPKNAGTYGITVDVAEADNYKAKSFDTVTCGSFEITKAQITITKVTVADKVYNGEKNDATVTEVTFGGLKNNETLTMGTDFEVTAAYSSADASNTATVTGTVKLKDTEKANNYALADGSFPEGTTGKITKAETTLSFTAADAVYTGEAYDAAANIAKESNVQDSVTYYYYTDAEYSEGKTETAPTNVGTYYVKGVIAETTNATAAEYKTSFKITPKSLADEDVVVAVTGTYEYDGDEQNPTFTVKYGTKDADYTAVYTNNVYAGTATIKLTGKGNYTGTKEATFEIAQKEVSLTWKDAKDSTVVDNVELYYNGEAQKITATVGGTVNSDEIAATVVGGTQTEIGKYIARVTGLTGDKAANYKLPQSVSLNYNIVAALSDNDLVVYYNGNEVCNTVTATINGLDIDLVGYYTGDTAVTVAGAGATVSGNILTIHDVEYTINFDGVTKMPDNITVSAPGKNVTKSEDFEVDGVTPDQEAQILDALEASSVNNTINAAVAELIATVPAEPDNLAEDKTVDSISVQVSLNIEAKKIGNNRLKLEIEPVYQVTYNLKDEEGNSAGTATTAVKDVPNNMIKGSMTVQVGIPAGFTPNFAKHDLGGGKFEYLKVTISGDGTQGNPCLATWEQSSFSPVELIVSPVASVQFQYQNASKIWENVEYNISHVDTNLPTDSQSGQVFKGWKFKYGGSSYVAVDTVDTFSGKLTSELLNAMNGKGALTAEPVFEAAPPAAPSTGGGGGGGGGVTTYTIKATAGEGGTISPSGSVKVNAGADQKFTFTPNAGYRVKEVKVDGKAMTVTSNTYTFKNVKDSHTIAVTFEKSAYVNPFTDVSTSAYYYDAVQWAVEQGITSGMTATTFVPSATCNRGQMVTFLWRAAGKPEPKSTVNPFTDVNESAYYYKAVLWAVEQGITNGTTATTFGPGQACNRGQMATFLWRSEGKAANSGDNAFVDVNTGAYYYNAVLWAAERGITTGKTASTFAPGEVCNRGQMVTFLYRNAQAK